MALRSESEMQYKSIPEMTPTQIERFWSRVDKSAGPDGCWLWTGYIKDCGHGKLYINRIGYLAHRVAFVIAGNDLPRTLVLDHVKNRGCTNKNCVNPAHLEPVTIAENSRRGEGICARHILKTHCPKGHPYDAKNTGIKTGTTYRYCLQCAREWARQKRASRAR
jgi:hypothetical protein